MGGRLVTQLAAERPDQTIAVLLIDAIVGDTWDKMVYLFRVAPPLLAAVGAALAVDSLGVVPLFSDPRQAMKLAAAGRPDASPATSCDPWRLAGPMISILRSRSSRYALNELADWEVPVFALHGGRDLPVPLRTARDAVRPHQRHAGHRRGRRALLDAARPRDAAGHRGGADGRRAGRGLRRRPAARRASKRAEPTLADIEKACYARTPASSRSRPLELADRRSAAPPPPRYHWTISRPLRRRRRAATA